MGEVICADDFRQIGSEEVDRPVAAVAAHHDQQIVERRSPKRPVGAGIGMHGRKGDGHGAG